MKPSGLVHIEDLDTSKIVLIYKNTSNYYAVYENQDVYQLKPFNESFFLQQHVLIFQVSHRTFVNIAFVKILYSEKLDLGIYGMVDFHEKYKKGLLNKLQLISNKA